MSAVSLPEKVGRHCRSHCNDEAANPRSRKLLGVVGSEVSAEERAHDHEAAFSPNYGMGHNEGDDRDAVDDPAEHDLQRIHSVNVGHAECGEHGEVQNPTPAP